MRFLVLVAAAAAIGATSVVAVPRLFPEHHASMVAAMNAASAQAAQFRLADLNPLRWDYDYVQREITSPDRKLDFPIGTPVVVDQSKMLTSLGPGLSLGGDFAPRNSVSPRLNGIGMRR
jgi:hypothetical protein